MQHYIYDAGGERKLKAGSAVESVYENASLVDGSNVVFNTYTTYPSAFIVVNGDGQYSKHYYVGAQRIVNRVASQMADIFETSGLLRSTQDSENPEGNSFDENTVRETQINDLKGILKKAKKDIPNFKEFKPAIKENKSGSANLNMH